MSMAQKEIVLKFFSIFSSGCHLDQWSRTVLAIFVKDDKKNIFVKLYWFGSLAE